MWKKSAEIVNSICSNLWHSKPKTYTQIAKEIGRGANPSTIKKYCMALAGLDNKTKKLKEHILNWNKKGNHIYYSINYDIYKKRVPKEHEKFIKNIEKKYNIKLIPRDFNYLLKKVRKKKLLMQ